MALKILALSGSLRKASTNTGLLRVRSVRPWRQILFFGRPARDVMSWYGHPSLSPVKPLQ